MLNRCILAKWPVLLFFPELQPIFFQLEVETKPDAVYLARPVRPTEDSQEDNLFTNPTASQEIYRS